MNAKISITFLTAIFSIGTGLSRNQEVSDSLTRELQEIIVTAKQPATKLVGSTLVSTISGSNLANLGNALDVLAQLPMLRVQDKDVSIIGKNNIEIYIDGRPMRDEGELQQILSSNLKKVELLMAPGAAYESTTDAVLKITTRKSFMNGLSFSEQFQLQRRRKWSMMEHFGLNHRTDCWDFFFNGAINCNNSLIKGSTTNTLLYEDKKTIVGSSQYNSSPTAIGSAKAGFNYTKGMQSFGAYYLYSPEHVDFNNSGTEWLDNNPALKREIDKRIRSHSHLASLYYENTFADKFLLHFDGDFRLSITNNSVATTYPESTSPDVNSTDERNSTLLAGKLYLNFPLWSGDFTVGTQDSHTQTSLDYRMLNTHVGQYIPTSITDAKQTSAALYASWSRIFNKLSLSAGARYEYVDYDFKIITVR